MADKRKDMKLEISNREGKVVMWTEQTAGISATNISRLMENMTDKQRDMVAGVDWLLKKFSKYSDYREFTVEEIIRASNEVVKEILTEVEK